MIRKLTIGALALALTAVACTTSETAGSGDGDVLQPDEPSTQRPGSFAGTEPAPEFPSGLDWLNVERPLSMAELRGKVVVLDFWTYGCINCIHVIPDLKRLEREYPDELVVVGVHSAKFENEGETDNIRDVVARYDLEHPVVNDSEFAVWNLWGARAWPTLVIIDPAGNVVGGHSGEGIYGIFQPVIDSLVEEFDERGRLDRTPLELVLEKDAIPDSVLSFPGKVLADADGQRLFVADTNHHRIVIADLGTGEVLDVAGTGTAGFGNGGFADAQFDQPQGMALSSDGATLYLADPGTHTVRALDLAAREVSTVLGIGSQADTYPPTPGGTDVAISSPWDVAVSGSTLYVAMAGSHQIWSLDLESGDSGWFVGNGRESTRNGARLDAELAQPSAVVIVGDRIAFADSESSAIRYAEIEEGGATGVLAGTDENLFDFGDVDGVGTAARLQHPLGLDLGDGRLWVADTYNSKIKALDPATLEIETFAGGEQGWADGVGSAARFSEPGGVSYSDGLLYVADTNNHAVRIVDLESGDVSTLVLYGIERFPSASPGTLETIDLGTIEVGPGSGTLAIDVAVPDGYKLNDLAPFSITWTATSTLLAEPTYSETAPDFPIAFEAEFAGTDQIVAEVTTYYCTDDAEALCFIDQVIVRADVAVAEGAGSEAAFSRTIPDPGF